MSPLKEAYVCPHMPIFERETQPKPPYMGVWFLETTFIQ